MEPLSDGLLHRIASAMTFVQATEGQVFVEEGKPVENIIILEEGTLVRTKLATDQADSRDESQHKIRHFRNSSLRLEFILDNSVVVDKLQGKGRISGLLHSIRPGGHAYATVTASSDECRLWLLDAKEFRAIISESPDYAMDIMAALAKELRSGTKSLRGMIQAVQKTEKPPDMDPNTQSIKVLCYDSTTWTTQGFEPAVKAFNEAHLKSLYIDMKFTTERLSEQTATFAAGYDAV